MLGLEFLGEGNSPRRANWPKKSQQKCSLGGNKSQLYHHNIESCGGGGGDGQGMHTPTMCFGLLCFLLFVFVVLAVFLLVLLTSFFW